MTKVCSKCSQSKSMDDFYNNKANSDGKQGYCKECMNQANRARRKERYANDAAYRQRQRDHARRYYHETGKARQSESGDRWAYTYTARCKRVGVSPMLEPFSRQDVIDEYGDKCFYCQRSAFEELDHFTPVAQGGPHTLENVRPSCAKCNFTKGDSDPLEFIASSMAVGDPDEAVGHSEGLQRPSHPRWEIRIL